MEDTQTEFVYVHGLPGSEEELSLFIKNRMTYISPFGLKAFADQFDPTKRYKILGFSLGSKTAIEIATHYSEHIEQLILISPAAPLELGNFLNDMDGRFVFNTAKRSSTLFRLLTFSQNLMARFAPNFLMKKMFGESCSADLELLNNPKFVAAFQNGLRQSLSIESEEYQTAIKRYIEPWADLIGKVACPVQIWHGTEDTWAPHAMSEALEASFKAPCELVSCNELGHYSTLHYAMRTIFKNHPVGN